HVPSFRRSRNPAVLWIARLRALPAPAMAADNYAGRSDLPARPGSSHSRKIFSVGGALGRACFPEGADSFSVNGTTPEASDILNKAERFSETWNLQCLPPRLGGAGLVGLFAPNGLLQRM